MWCFLFISLLAASPPAFEVQTLDGDQVTGAIVALSADQVTVQTGEGPVSLDTERITGLSRTGAFRRGQETRAERVGMFDHAHGGASGAMLRPSSGIWVELAGGSKLAGAHYAVRDGLATITVASGDLIELSVRDVAAVQLQPPTDMIAAEWSQILESERDRDLLVVRKDDSIDYHRGSLGDVTEAVVQFDLDGDVLPVKRSKVYGLIYYQPAGRELADPVCWLTDADGSLWAVRSIGLEGENLHWTTPLGLEITRPLDAVVRIDFSRGKIVYLSDLEPESLVWTPYFGSAQELPALARFFAPREDRSLAPGPLRLGGKPFQKGLALHSRTSLVYRLPGRFRRFEAVAGIDDRVRPHGNVRLVIRGDDRILLETTLAGTDPPQSIDLDLTGASRLVILVDYGDDLDLADHLDLCEARIVK